MAHEQRLQVVQHPVGGLASVQTGADAPRGRSLEGDGALEARAQSLPTQTNPANNLSNIRNSGLLRFAQDDTGTYVGQIVGPGLVEKTGGGVTTLAPSVAAGNTYSGSTRLNQGTLAVAANSALRARSQAIGLDVFVPPRSRCTDNGAMIANAGRLHLVAGRRDALDFVARPSWAVA